MSKPRISFVIPFFNKSKSIKKCLKHLFSQSIKEFEVIVAMDGPDPESRKVIEKNKKIKIIDIEHGGACKARNEGAKHATGEFIVFWDADCYIEHGAAAVWLQIFDQHKDIDFVYSGYRFQEVSEGMPGEKFDPWLLRVNNYISGCFPIRREKAPRWDESLKSLQDWDFWLTAVENGSKGYFIRGYAFSTDFPDKDSISGKGCTPENWLSRLETVKRKHDIYMPDYCVSAISSREDGIRLAKMIKADYRDHPTYFPNKYKTVIQLGFSPRQADTHARNFQNLNGPEVKKVIFWRASDIYCLKYEAAMAASEALAIAINSSVHHQFCEDIVSQRMLEKIGFKAEILPLPMIMDEIKPLPEQFKVLVDSSVEYESVINSIVRACPDIKIDKFMGSANLDDYSCLLKLSNERSMDTNVKKMLLGGRRVISNIQSPYCGYVSDVDGVDKMRNEIIDSIRSYQKIKENDEDAMKFYKELCSPEKFLEAFKPIIHPVEVPA